VQRHHRRQAAVLLGILWALGLFWVQPAPPVRAQEAAQATTAPQLSDAQIEKFLTDARIVKSRNVGKGVTNSLRATLTDGTITHDAHIQIVDESRTTGPSARGTELNFRDSWMFNVAAYRIDRLIGLKLVPVSIERKNGLKAAAFTWWVDDVMMDEGERLKKDIQPPSPQLWNESMQLIRLFDQLIYNVDRNMGNLVITKDWRVWAIDHTRAFRLHRTLAKPANVTRCDRGVLEGLKKLDKQTLQDSVGKYLTNWEREALLSRRDEIVKLIEKSGDTALFERKQ
jgi:hypothetical protein